MWDWWFVPVLVGMTTALGLLVWRPWRRWGKKAQFRRAQALFQLQREHLEAHFLPAAAATGKPRGLRWLNCDWENDVVYARERQTGLLLALVGVIVRFEAVEGGDMEGLPAVANLRNASAVFFFHKGRWHTGGKAVFNLNPDEAVRHFKNQYELVS